MVITPLKISELKSFFNQKAMATIDYFISKAMFAQPELMPGQDPNPIHVPKEHIEQWIVQALGVAPVGSGSYPVDVIKNNEWGADVKMLSCKVDAGGNLRNSDSGETSLAQKFTDTGSDLDTLFKGKKYDIIIDGFKEILKNKLSKVIKEKKINDIYYFIILRAEQKFYLCGMSVDIGEIENVEVQKSSDQSVWTKYFINEKYGSVKIYKAKKRMELRLRPKKWFVEGLLLEIQIHGNVPEKNIIDIISDENKISKHIRFLYKSNFKSIDE